MRKRESMQQVRYAPAAAYRLDLEIFSAADLRRRVDAAELCAPQQIDFHLFIFVTTGSGRHTVDFEEVEVAPGTLLALRPAQAQQFDRDAGWNGWLLVFRPELLLPAQAGGSVFDSRLAIELGDLPAVVRMAQPEAQAFGAALAQMHGDADLSAAADILNGLLRYQLYALVLRLRIGHGQAATTAAPASPSLLRYRRFSQLLELNFAKWHQVAPYAKTLGCSDKSLTRAVNEVAGVHAKAAIAKRIMLEAKRMLVHTAVPVGVIADRLGFDEPTNFVKFFRRECGLAPGQFRRQHARNPVGSPLPAGLGAEH